MVQTQHDKYAAAAQEDRSAHRTRISIPATLRASGSKTFQTVVRDLSLSGYSATSMTRLNPGTACWLTLPGMESHSGQVVWWDNGIVGVAFNTLLSPVILDDLFIRWRTAGLRDYNT